MLSAVALVAIMAQTMSVFVGKVVYRYNTEQTGKMEYTEVNDYVDAPEINAENVDEFLKIYIENGEISEADLD